MRVTGILLAAGKSTRLGRDKLAVVMPDGRALAAWSLQAALDSDLEQVICVVKPEDSLAWLPENILHVSECSSTYRRGTKLQIALSTEYSSGMAASLQCGLKEATEYGAEGVMILLADQPLIRAQDINQVSAALSLNKLSDYAAAADGERLKPPVAFRSHMFEHLLALGGDEGARKIMRNDTFSGTQVTLPDFCFWDADTESELKRIMDYVNESAQMK
ncbi:nucleotidyltransferase family protein [Paenibacillus sp. ACRRY]|uniref:nucleotidyltransferase family protein n=1 Tax=Paenibacillus sp. ACRRY TaxID=2918208 RepID=UPI001EF47D81|nr:nucleotidyltransferase family protein [Paenibacillus sp. ACRRY]MCG7381823.1 nucleotidyltransferase family protein [Paenibacillus sp. ACRRY]